MSTLSNKSTTSHNYHVVIPAGGSGQRMHQVNEPSEHVATAKQYLQVVGKTILEHAVEPFIADSDCLSIFIAVADSQIAMVKTLFENPKIHIVRGGKTRSQSVLAGLNALLTKDNENAWVMVHDAARANLYSSDVEKLKTSVMHEPYGGILACPAKDTLKRVSGNSVLETIDRQNIWHAMTPQMFRLGKLFTALNQLILEGVEITDEASAMEYIGAKVVLIEGRADNIKLTFSHELNILQALLKRKTQ